MITFRKDTSFPFLKIARESGVSYRKVLRIAEAMTTDGDLSIAFDKTVPDELIQAVGSAVMRENTRRLHAHR
jgi:predicted regulator of amino acid metabolism with ACT domain